MLCEEPLQRKLWLLLPPFENGVKPHGRNEQRNRLRGPNYKSLDFSLQRRINVTKRVSTTLRWDVFNALNTVNFGLPNRNISDSVNVGTITSLGGDPRLMQVSIRLAF